MQVDVAPLTDPDLAYELGRAVWRHELPDIPFTSRRGYLAGFHQPFPGRASERYLGLLDGVPAGFVELRLPLLDNLETAEMDLGVLPGHRRHGVGRALHDHAVARVRELGRKRIFAESDDDLPDGTAFGTAVGADAALVETRSRLDVDPDDQPRLDGLLADAVRHADGYRVVRWIGVAPDDIIDDVAVLDGRFVDEAPTGGLVIEGEKVDAQRIRDTEEANRLRGRTRWHCGAQHIASGKLVAWTMLAGSDEDTWHAWQNVTLVDPAHRGHRLGLTIKIENLRYAREHRPELRAIDTYNAAENEHMLAINRAMGFRPVGSLTGWQITV